MKNENAIDKNNEYVTDDMMTEYAFENAEAWNSEYCTNVGGVVFDSNSYIVC